MKEKQMQILLLPVLCLLLLVAGCGIGSGKSKEKKQGDASVYLGGEVVEKDDKILIEGQSNLLEGARVTGEVYVNEDELFADTTELVDKKGNFEMDMEHPTYGEAVVVVSFEFDGVQDEEIAEHYGELGEKLEGPYVYITEHYEADQVEQKAEVRLVLDEDDEETKHVFAAPEWEKRPKDYGDARVWMEVDEVTDDGEFFYFTGKSNMLEGAKLKVSHASNTETRVQKDGSFEVKLPYQYREDKPIVVEYRPFDQWGSIAEQYGKNGEKLVGNLVQHEGNQLKLVYEIEYE